MCGTSATGTARCGSLGGRLGRIEVRPDRRNEAGPFQGAIDLGIDLPGQKPDVGARPVGQGERRDRSGDVGTGIEIHQSHGAARRHAGADRLGHAEGRGMDGAEWRGDQMPAQLLSDPGLAGDERGEILISDRRRQRRHHEAGSADGGCSQPRRARANLAHCVHENATNPPAPSGIPRVIFNESTAGMRPCPSPAENL